MSRGKETAPHSEARVEGLLVENGVEISDKQTVDELSTRGYGVTEDDEFLLTFYEAMYLLDKGTAEIENRKGESMDFEEVLHRYEAVDDDAWVKYLTYRDLRSRGYVVRDGFGWGIDFRVYERGKYNKKTAKYLILSMQEGKPIPLGNLTRVLGQCQSLKKELVLAVMNRRGEIVYYLVSEMNLK